MSVPAEALLVDLIDTVGQQIEVVAEEQGGLLPNEYAVGLWSSIYRDIGKTYKAMRRKRKSPVERLAMGVMKTYQAYLTKLDIGDKYTRAGRSISTDDMVALAVTSVKFRETLHWILHSSTDLRKKRLKVSEFRNALV